MPRSWYDAPVAGVVVILEDDVNRITAMRASLADVLPGLDIAVFEDAHQMIAWLGGRLGQVVLISLDHDLPLRQEPGRTVDCGTGRQVADFLASMPPTCPVIVHSSNDPCATGMFFTLKDAGWPCSRIYPSPDPAWIRDAWVARVRRYVRDGWIARG
jgi:hypothetical protein